MCKQCWENAGQPANWTPEIARALALTKELYAIHAAGGPLHVALDEWNIEGEITPWYDGYADEQLDALYSGGWPLDELPEGAPARITQDGRSTRQICDELTALLNPMPVADRRAMLAYHDGILEVPND